MARKSQLQRGLEHNARFAAQAAARNAAEAAEKAAEAAAQAAALAEERTPPSFEEAFPTVNDRLNCLESSWEETLSSFNGCVLDLTPCSVHELPASLLERAANLREIVFGEESTAYMCQSDLALLAAGDLDAFLDMLGTQRAQRRAQYASLTEKACDDLRLTLRNTVTLAEEEEEEEELSADDAAALADEAEPAEAARNMAALQMGEIKAGS